MVPAHRAFNEVRKGEFVLWSGIISKLWLIVGTRCRRFSQILTAPATEFIAEDIFKAASRAALHKLCPTLIA
jgi:hypothetical protein